MPGGNHAPEIHHPPQARFQNGNRVYKVVLLGEGGVGKSALTLQFVSHIFHEDHDPTIEDAYQKQVVIDGHACILDVLDTAGQEEFTAMREQYMRGGEGFIVVYSVIDRSSFEKIRKFKDMIEKVRNCEIKDIPLVLAGNKKDLGDKRKVTKVDGETLAQDLSCPFFGTSAAIRDNVDEVFQEVVRVIRRKETEMYHKMQGTSSKSRKSGLCCMSSSAVDN